MSLRTLVEDYRSAPSADDLQELGAQLLEQVRPVASASADPVDLLLAVESAPWPQLGTWQEVRACCDEGLLTAEEYAYLSALFDAKPPTRQEFS